MVDIKKIELVEIRCPYCNDFYDYMIPDNFFWDGSDSRTVYCYSSDCGLPFEVVK